MVIDSGQVVHLLSEDLPLLRPGFTWFSVIRHLIVLFLSMLASSQHTLGRDSCRPQQIWMSILSRRSTCHLSVRWYLWLFGRDYGNSLSRARMTYLTGVSNSWSYGYGMAGSHKWPWLEFLLDRLGLELSGRSRDVFRSLWRESGFCTLRFTQVLLFCRAGCRALPCRLPSAFWVRRKDLRTVLLDVFSELAL